MIFFNAIFFKLHQNKQKQFHSKQYQVVKQISGMLRKLQKYHVEKIQESCDCL